MLYKNDKEDKVKLFPLTGLKIPKSINLYLINI